ncbi:MAG: UDP-N-acetylglucosamine--N-acetylmuramyl-(pentapeptide) pyrophosphoryl-undecaprenol N-acetylglucosamine transferase, partial [Rhodospirillales bacterium]|nr:UDP-N-acetylglucosamine--N-acetylmuramyl-(pentapeptide) pyrophosphoryl-undecaprenol N-acetylglucosamine transferase [Rhodospirillales bacterium]
MTAPGLIVLAAGGTGGHLFPAEALAAELSGRGFRLALVTDARGRPFSLQGGEVATHRVAGGGLAGKNPWAQAKAAFGLALGATQALGLLGRLGPRAVVGFGGYASFPTVLAAILRGLPTAIHEQNAVLGRANRMLARGRVRIATSFPATRGLPKGTEARAVCTGMPVRPAVAALAGRPYRAPQAGNPVSLVVIGGSQGARIFADVVPPAVARTPDDLRRHLRIAQQCRPEDLERTRKAYAGMNVAAELATFFADAPERMASAHLVIARAGASTVAELAALGRPAILVPYRYAADDHQGANARALAEAGAAWAMAE